MPEAALTPATGPQGPAFAIPRLDTARLSLALWTPGDIADLVALDDDPQVVRYVGATAPRAERQASLEAMIDTPWQRPVLVTRQRQDGAFLGWTFLRPFRDGSPEWEIGYRLRRDAWGQGFATEACRALMAWGWQQPSIPAIGAVFDPANTASRHVLAKLGLTPAGERAYWGEMLPYWELRRPVGTGAAASGR